MSSPHARPRLQFRKVAPAAYEALAAFDDAVGALGLEPTLSELVRVRASQLNGCAFCLDMHTKDARARGESEMRLHTLAAWRETPFFTERERAALAWTEAVTLLGEHRVTDALYEETRRHFEESEVAALTLLAIAINAWNRIGVTARAVPGNYVSTVAPSLAQSPAPSAAPAHASVAS